jgi:ABC-2 type transport system ATP-binding protein
MGTENVICLKSLTKYYRDVRAINGLDLEIHEGEIFGFLGPNGAGKTTTIRLLLGFIKPTLGSASIFDFDTFQDGVQVRKLVGYLPADIKLYGKMTGNQLLQYLSNLREGTDWDLVEELRERLETNLTQPIRSLSRGNKQKIGLIQAFMNRPELIIMDEPTSGLDPLIQQEFYKMLDDVKADGRTVFISSHNMQEVERVCDRVGIIRLGEIVAVDEIHDLKERSIHKFEIHFSGAVSTDTFRTVDGIQDIVVEDNIVLCTVLGKPDAFIKTASSFEILRLISHEPSLEDVFLSYYGGN